MFLNYPGIQTDSNHSAKVIWSLHNTARQKEAGPSKLSSSLGQFLLVYSEAKWNLLFHLAKSHTINQHFTAFILVAGYSTETIKKCILIYKLHLQCTGKKAKGHCGRNSLPVATTLAVHRAKRICTAMLPDAQRFSGRISRKLFAWGLCREHEQGLRGQKKMNLSISLVELF